MDALTSYFEGEKNGGLLIAAIGAVALIGAVVLFPERLGLRAFAITLGVCALVEIAVGAGLYLKTGPQLTRLLAQLASNATELYASEIPRMMKVQRNFVVLEYLWLSAVVLSAATAVVRKAHSTASGIALGVLVQVSIFLAFDMIAERRGAAYLAHLESSVAPR